MEVDHLEVFADTVYTERFTYYDTTRSITGRGKNVIAFGDVRREDSSSSPNPQANVLKVNVSTFPSGTDEFEVVGVVKT